MSSIVALHVAVNEFRCYEVEIEEWEKAISHRQSNPGHLWLELPVVCTFLYFCLITSKYISRVGYSVHVTGCHLCSVSTHQEEKHVWGEGGRGGGGGGGQ